MNVFPNVLKLAKAVPIHNKGDSDNPGSYMLYSVLGKIFEVIMKRQLGDYLNKDVILSSEQHEFGRGHLTVMAVAYGLPDGKNLQGV